MRMEWSHSHHSSLHFVQAAKITVERARKKKGPPGSVAVELQSCKAKLLVVFFQRALGSCATKSPASPKTRRYKQQHGRELQEYSHSPPLFQRLSSTACRPLPPTPPRGPPLNTTAASTKTPLATHLLAPSILANALYGKWAMGATQVLHGASSAGLVCAAYLACTCAYHGTWL